MYKIIFVKFICIVMNQLMRGTLDLIYFLLILQRINVMINGKREGENYFIEKEYFLLHSTTIVTIY